MKKSSFTIMFCLIIYTLGFSQENCLIQDYIIKIENPANVPEVDNDEPNNQVIFN